VPLEKIDKSIAEVAEFWNRHPLFSGEARYSIGTPEWFREHETVYINDCFAGSEPDAIFSSGVAAAASVLDVGCGPGFWVRYFARRGFDVHGCDISDRAVELTKRSLEIFALKAQVRLGNAEALPYADASFDHVNCQGVIHHTPRPEEAIREFHRVLRPRGTACFSVYHRNFLLRSPRALRLFAKLFGGLVKLRGRGRERLLASGEADEIVRMYDGADNPIGRAYTEEDLRRMTDGLFEVRDVGLFFFPARALPCRIPRVLHRWLHRRFGLMIIVRAERTDSPIKPAEQA
jgi:SAM-dependent methyltransferase